MDLGTLLLLALVGAVLVVLTLGFVLFRTTRGDSIRLQARLADSEARFAELLAVRDAVTSGGDDPDEDWPEDGGAPIANVPEVPRDLVDACRDRTAVLFAGGGVSASAGYPTWRELLIGIIDQQDPPAPLGSDTTSEWTSMRVGVLSRPNDIADILGSRLGVDRILRSLNIEYAGRVANDSPLLSALSAIPFSTVMTPNWDRALEDAFDVRNPSVLTLEDANLQFGSNIRKRAFQILKLYGSIDPPRGFFFTPAEYRAALYQNTSFSSTVASLFLSNTILFVGTSTASLEDFLAGLPMQFDRRERPHFALVPWTISFTLDAERFDKRFGIRLLPFVVDEGYTAVTTFARRLRSAVEHSDMGTDLDVRDVHIDELGLFNIGPFENLKLKFRPGWNVILGNNGCGKSSILRAIALAVGGDDQRLEASGGRLLRSGSPLGWIELTAGRDIYRTELVAEATRIAVRAARPTELQAGTWMVLGFPSVRGISTGDRAPEPRRRPTAVVDDVLPLLTGKTDSRMDDIKKWVLLSTFSNDRSQGIDADRKRQLLRTFFEILDELTPGVHIEYSRIEEETWQVYVRTDDGEVSIDQVSQGTASIIGWAGTLLQRLYEIYPTSPAPEHEPAVVLIDEIDAHLHPEWQQSLVPLVRDRFSKLQVIATTHSPLIIGAMDETEVVRLQRDISGVRVVPIDESMKGLRADQILTSSAFGLKTTRDADSVKLLDDYTEYFAKSNRTQEEDRKLEELEGEVQRTIPGAAERPAERAARQLVDDALIREIDTLPDGERDQILAEAQAYVAKVRGSAK